SQKLLAPRACAALESFREIILDGRAVMTGSFVERLEQTAGASLETGQAPAEIDAAADPEALTGDDETNLAFVFPDADSSFDFGALEDASEALEVSTLAESAVETGPVAPPANAA